MNKAGEPTQPSAIASFREAGASMVRKVTKAVHPRTTASDPHWLLKRMATAVPSTNPTGGGIIYVESGALKYRGSSGTVTTLGAA